MTPNTTGTPAGTDREGKNDADIDVHRLRRVTVRAHANVSMLASYIGLHN